MKNFILKEPACSRDHGGIVNGHFDRCQGAGWCSCTEILFDIPRSIIGAMIHSYYTSQCITEMVKYDFSFEYVLSHF